MLLHLFQKGERHTFHRQIGVTCANTFFDGVFIAAIAGFVLHHMASYNRLQEHYLSNQMLYQYVTNFLGILIFPVVQELNTI